jgi:hypothetical protein
MPEDASSPCFPHGLEAALCAHVEAAYYTASRSWTSQPAHPLDANPSRTEVLGNPRAWLTICLQSQHKPNISKVIAFLFGDEAIDAVEAVMRVAVGPAPTEGPDDKAAVPPPTAKVSLQLVFRQCCSNYATHGRVARGIVHAITRRLSLHNAARTKAILSLLDEPRRSKLVFLEPLRRLCALSAASGQPAAAAASEGAWHEALLQALELVSTSASPTCRFRPSVVSELLSEARHVAVDMGHVTNWGSTAAGGSSTTADGSTTADSSTTADGSTNSAQPLLNQVLPVHASLAHLLRTRLAPLLAAEDDAGATTTTPQYEWASAADYLPNPAVHWALLRTAEAARAQGENFKADQGAAALLAATRGDLGELACALGALLHGPVGSALLHGPVADGAVALAILQMLSPTGRRSVAMEDGDGRRGEHLHAGRRCVALEDEGAVLGARVAIERLGAPGWRVALDAALGAGVVADGGGGGNPATLCVPLRTSFDARSDEAAALSHWWPAVRLWVRQPGHSRYSGVLEGLLRRAARLHAQGGWLDSGGPRKRRMPGIISGGGGGSSSHAALELRAPLLPLHDARRLVDACALYLPAVLPLLRPSDALALLHAYALATARTPAAPGESTGPPEMAEIAISKPPEIAEIAISKLVDAASSWRRPPQGGAEPKRPPLQAGCALALLPLWYGRSAVPGALSEPTLDYSFAPLATLDGAGADLALCSHSSYLLAALYLPPAAPVARATLLLELAEQWAAEARWSCDVGAVAAARVRRVAAALANVRAALDAEAEALLREAGATKVAERLRGVGVHLFGAPLMTHDREH